MVATKRLWTTTMASLALALTACSGRIETSADSTSSSITKLPASDPQKSYTLFESGQVRPLALSEDGELLFATNTPDNRLEIFKAHGGKKLQPVASVPVGLEPVSVAVRNDHEVWVVNHLSDSVSIVEVSHGRSARVVRTLLVGDEPRDIVFAGRDHDRAFITTAHRGQNTHRDPQLTTPGAGRADVWVFDANNLGASLEGTPLTVVTLFADTPRALAVTPDGSRVYAAAFLSGNKTTVLSPDSVKAAGGLPAPHTNFQGYPQPDTGLIVKYRTGPDGKQHWMDASGRIWDPFVHFSLPDRDVFAIDATANPPALAGGVYSGVGTTLFNMVVNPTNGKVYVTNTEARNDTRFEGHGNFAANFGLKTVRGHIADSRITVIDPSAQSVTATDLNPHVNYDQEGTPAENALSVAFPQSMAITGDGSTLYVAALGSSKLAVYDTAALESGNTMPSAASQVALTGGGPTGVVLDSQSGTVYVLTRFDNSISIVDSSARQEIAHVAMFNPEPASVTKGRRFLYDASYTSSHGVAACGSCHNFGDFDSLAWDLGNPDGSPLPIAQDQFAVPKAAIVALLPATALVFQYFMPLKGPMTTQSLRGMDNHGSMHWRGDRNGGQIIDLQGDFAPSAQPNTGIYSENAAFIAFNVAFPGLLGRSAELDAGEMQAFTDFILQNTYPPNPIRALDNSLSAKEQAGRDFYFNAATLPNGQKVELPSDRFHNCNGCHTLDPKGNSQFGVAHPGFFGSDGRLSFEFESQIFKVPHLRNAYQKVGMFGMSPSGFNPDTTFRLPDGSTPFNPFFGEQIRGFGYDHDGNIDTVERFLGSLPFIRTTGFTTNPMDPNGPPIPQNPFGIDFGPAGAATRQNLEAFIFAYDSNLAPIVGQQTTLNEDNQSAADVNGRITLLEARAVAGECDLVVKARLGSQEFGFLFQNGVFLTNRTHLPSVTDAQLRAISGFVPLTYTAVPPGSGVRIALDRDGDGYADGDEQDRGSDPSDPHSTP